MRLVRLVAALLVAASTLPLRTQAAAGVTPKTIIPGENLVVDGIPPIPADLVDQVSRYTEARAVAFVDWHPTRPEMLILTRFADTNQVHLVTQPGGAATTSARAN